MTILGIDIGGSGIKGALVDIEKGEFASERHRIPTPQPATPEAVTDTVAEIVKHFDYEGIIGCTFPAIMKRGVAHSAANVDQSFIGTDVQALIEEKTGCKTIVLNDADAAGVAEMRFGKGQESDDGTVILLTVGTGIGSAIFVDGELLTNSELGHLVLPNGVVGEKYAADRIREEEDLSWSVWGKRLNKYLQHVEFLFSPDLLILGGGVSKKFDKYDKKFKLKTEIVPADLRNKAGIIGAAVMADRILNQS